MKSNFQIQFERLNEDLKERYNLPDSFFEDRERLIPSYLRTKPERWIRFYLKCIMKYINSYRLKTVYDQYLILKLDDDINQVLEDLGNEHNDSISVFIEYSLEKIRKNKRYLEFYSALRSKFPDRSVITYQHVRELIEKNPNGDWNLSCADWFGSMSDDKTIDLINRMRSLLSLLNSL